MVAIIAPVFPDILSIPYSIARGRSYIAKL